MKKSVIRMMLLAATLLAAACKDETPGYLVEPEGPQGAQTDAAGYLSLAPEVLTVLVDAQTDQSTDAPSPLGLTTRADYTTDPGVPRGNEADAAALDDFLVTVRGKSSTATGADASIYDKTFTYRTLKDSLANAANLGKRGLTVPVGIYEVLVTSHNEKSDGDYVRKPTGVQQLPSYAGDAGVAAGGEILVEKYDKEKDNYREIKNIVCKLQNVKITVEVSADLLDKLDVIDAAEGYLIDAEVYYGKTKDVSTATAKWEIPHAWDWWQNRQTPVYFPEPAADEKLWLRFKARMSGSDTELELYKEVSGIVGGQWRRIRVVPKYATQGDITFDVEIDSFVQDGEIEIGDSAGASERILWSELPYFDPTAAPVIAWADGSDLPATIEVGSAVQDVVITAANGLERVSLQFATENPDFAEDVELLAIADLCTVVHSSLLEAYGIPYGTQLAGQSEVTFNFASVFARLAGHEGDYTFTFVLTDSVGNETTQSIVFHSGAGGSGGGDAPTVTWAGGKLFDESGYNANGTPKSGAEFVELYDGMSIRLSLNADPHFEAIKVTITSQTLTEDVLALAGLPLSFDLCNLKDFTDASGEFHPATDQEDALTNPDRIYIINKVNGALKAESSATFDITKFVDILLGFEKSKFQFALTVVDANGNSTTKYLRLQTR